MIKLVIALSLLTATFVSAGCATTPNFNRELDTIVESRTFSIAQWEFATITHGLKQWFSNDGVETDGDADLVIRYFAMAEQIRALESQVEAAGNGGGHEELAALEVELAGLQQQRTEMTEAVEEVISRQIRETLRQQGIFNPIADVRVSFPPLNFTLEEPPHLLVVSPRDRIESMREVTLKQDIGLAETEEIEAAVDGLGVSSLVVGLGGFGGTFPTFVADNGSLRFTIDSVIEEWLHQYLVFTPLGFLYLLDATGVSPNYEIATMNETVAGMVSTEIGAMVCAKYYPGYEAGANQVGNEEFNQAMRVIRGTVDEYLARGEIEAAERFMEERRQYLASQGYYLRKLNQAYFAYYGTYADSPTSISPIGIELKKLREQSTSIKDFLDRAAGITSREDLKLSIEAE